MGLAKERITAIREAYAEMKRRGWGFASNGCGFGDPKATVSAIGPCDGVLVSVLAADPDPVEAVRKAIEKTEGINADKTQGAERPI